MINIITDYDLCWRIIELSSNNNKVEQSNRRGGIIWEWESKKNKQARKQIKPIIKSTTKPFFLLIKHTICIKPPRTPHLHAGSLRANQQAIYTQCKGNDKNMIEVINIYSRLCIQLQCQLLTLIKSSSCMTIHCIQQGAYCITPTGYNIIGGHEPKCY